MVRKPTLLGKNDGKGFSDINNLNCWYRTNTRSDEKDKNERNHDFQGKGAERF